MIRRAFLFAVLAVLSIAPVYGGANIIDYSLPRTVPGQPWQVLGGADGHTWFIDGSCSCIVRVNDDNTLTDFRTVGGVTSIALGADGAIWFTTNLDRVQRLDPFTGVISLDIYVQQLGYYETHMVTGADGNLWIVHDCAAEVLRVTPGGNVRQFPITSGACVTGIVLGPDGNVWLAEHYKNAIGRMTVDGNFAEVYIPPDNGADVTDITVGPDNNLWVTPGYNGGLRRVTTAGAVTIFGYASALWAAHITAGADGLLYQGSENTIQKTNTLGQVPAAYTTSPNAQIRDIARGPDGNVWAAGYGNNTIIRLTPAGQLTEIPANVKGGDPTGIAQGSDGNYWFTEKTSNKIGRMTPGGTVTEYQIPEGNSQPTSIVAGSDGALWFIESAADKIGRITTGGSITEFQLTLGLGLEDLTVGNDGNLWITGKTANKVVKLTTGGTPTYFTIPNGRTQPAAIVRGGDGKVWFNLSGNILGRYDTSGNYTESLAYTNGYGIEDMVYDAVSGKIHLLSGPSLWNVDTAGNVAFDGIVGSWPKSELAAAADGTFWITDYGTSSLTHVTAGGYTDYPTNQWGTGPRGVVVGSDGNVYFAQQAASRIGKLMTRFEAVAATACYTGSFSGTLATIRDSAPPASTLGYTASINWGDGTSVESGTVTLNGDHYDVTGSHTFANNGAHPVKVTITDGDAPSDAVTVTAVLRTQLAASITFTQACQNAPIIAVATDLGPDTVYTWTVPGVILEKGGNRIKFSSPDPTVNVSVTITKPNWCPVTVDTSVSPGNCVVPHVSIQPNGTSVAGGNASVIVQALDQYNNLYPGYTGTVHFTSSDPLAVLPANYTFTGADAGQHTFTGLRFYKAGSPIVTVTDVNDASSTLSCAMTIAPAPAAWFAVAGPVGTAMGSTYHFTVTAYDQYDNLATNYTGTVHFTSTDAGALLPANYTYTGADQGAHAFTMKFVTNGTMTLTATDVSNSSVTGSSTVQVGTSLLYRDYQRDGMADLLWRNTSNGNISMWLMNATAFSYGAEVVAVGDQTWKIVGSADFNMNGIADIVWRNSSTGQNMIWFMNGASVVTEVFLPTVTDQQWQIEATADMNNDGYTDIVWHNHTTGLVTAWLMNGTNVVGAADMEYAAEPANWHIAAAADFDGDDDADLVWRNSANGRNVIWHMQNLHIAAGEELPSEPDLNWKIVACGDYTRDGKADLVWRNLGNGMDVIWEMNGSTLWRGIELPRLNDPNWKIVGPK